MGYMIHVKFIFFFSCIHLSCFGGFHHCGVFCHRGDQISCALVFLVTKGRQPKRLEFTIKNISSEMDINFQKNNVSFS